MTRPTFGCFFFLNFLIVSLSNGITIALFARSGIDGGAWPFVLVIHLLMNAVYTGCLAFIALRHGLSLTFTIGLSCALATTLTFFSNLRLISAVMGFSLQRLSMENTALNALLNSDLTLYAIYGVFLGIALWKGCHVASIQ